MEQTKENKMGTMPVNKLLVTMSLPMVISMIVQALYNIVDSIFVSRLSEDALTAVSMAFPMQNLMISVAVGTGVGINAMLSRALGEKKFEAANKTAENGIFIEVLGYVLFLLIGIFVTKPFFLAQAGAGDIANMGIEYTRICLLMSFGIFMQIGFERILQSTGRTIFTMITQSTGAIINIILDPILIFGLFGMPKMGVAGAGWATVIAQFISGILCFVYSLKKFPILRLTKHDWKFSWKFAWQHLEVGLPMAFQFSITAIGTMVIQSALNSLGSTAVAAFTAGSKIDQFATQPLASLGVAVATYTAQNYGARELERIKKGVTGAAIIATVCGIVGGFVVITFAKPLVALFVGSGQNEVMSLSKEYLVLNGVFYVILGLLFVYRNALQGIGSSMIAFFGGVWELVMRSLVAFVLVSYLKFAAVCIASPVAWFGATIWLMIAYFVIINRIIKKANFAKINY